MSKMLLLEDNFQCIISNVNMCARGPVSLNTTVVLLSATRKFSLAEWFLFSKYYVDRVIVVNAGSSKRIAGGEVLSLKNNNGKGAVIQVISR